MVEQTGRCVRAGSAGTGPHHPGNEEEVGNARTICTASTTRPKRITSPRCSTSGCSLPPKKNNHQPKAEAAPREPRTLPRTNGNPSDQSHISNDKFCLAAYRPAEENAFFHRVCAAGAGHLKCTERVHPQRCGTPPDEARSANRKAPQGLWSRALAQ